jgi:hypothetical protein
MTNLTKKELKILWNSLKDNVLNKLDKNISITDITFFSEFDREPYIALDICDICVFFIFKTDEQTIQIFSYKYLNKHIIESAAIIRYFLSRSLYNKNNRVKDD